MSFDFYTSWDYNTSEDSKAPHQLGLLVSV